MENNGKLEGVQNKDEVKLRGLTHLGNGLEKSLERF